MRRRHLRSKKCSEVHALNVDGETLIYTLERKNVRNINLRIRPDASIYVSAPHRVPLAEIEKIHDQQGLFLLSMHLNESWLPRPTGRGMMAETKLIS